MEDCKRARRNEMVGIDEYNTKPVVCSVPSGEVLFVASRKMDVSLLMQERLNIYMPKGVLGKRAKKSKEGYMYWLWRGFVFMFKDEFKPELPKEIFIQEVRVHEILQEQKRRLGYAK